MKKAIFTAVLLLFAINTYASEFKIGYVNLQKIIIVSDQGKEAQKTLSTIEQAQTTLINENIKEINKIEETLTKQQAILTPETKEQKKTELNNLILAYQKKGKEFKEKLQKKEAELINEIVSRVELILADIAKEQGYSAILNKAGIVYMDADLDLTNTVIDTLNKPAPEK